jgi:hypothetical protein
MSSAKIKKKSAQSTPASMMPRQGAIPCLILIVIGIIVIALILFFSLRSAG